MRFYFIAHLIDTLVDSDGKEADGNNDLGSDEMWRSIGPLLIVHPSTNYKGKQLY